MEQQDQATSRVSANQRASEVVLSHRTALEVARAVDLRRCARNAKPLSLAAEAPSKEDVQGAMSRLRTQHGHFDVARPVHYLVGGGGRHRTDRFSPHSLKAGVPARSVHRLFRGIHCATPEFAFVQECARQGSFLSALLLAWEMCGTYKTKRTSWSGGYDVPPLASAKSIRDFVESNPSLAGCRIARQTLPYLRDGSASERETAAALLLGLPARYGGYALGLPCMNFRVDATAEAGAIAGRSFFRCDLCWPEAKLDVEYQSREVHEGEESRISDSRRANALENMGWNVLSVTNKELEDPRAMDGIANTVRRRLRVRSAEYAGGIAEKRRDLRRALGLPA